MENPPPVSPTPIQSTPLPPLSPFPDQPSQPPLPPSSSNLLPVIIIFIIILLAAGALGFFYFQAKSKISGGQKIEASPAALNPLESAVPAASASAVPETGDPVFDQGLQNIDKGLEQMDKDTGEATQGLNDQQIDILQGM